MLLTQRWLYHMTDLPIPHSRRAKDSSSRVARPRKPWRSHLGYWNGLWQMSNRMALCMWCECGMPLFEQTQTVALATVQFGEGQAGDSLRQFRLDHLTNNMSGIVVYIGQWSRYMQLSSAGLTTMTSHFSNRFF